MFDFYRSRNCLVCAAVGSLGRDFILRPNMPDTKRFVLFLVWNRFILTLMWKSLCLSGISAA